MPSSFNSPARKDANLSQNIRCNFISDFFYLQILSESGGEAILQAAIRAHVLQHSLQFTDPGGGIVPLFGGSGFCSEIFPLTDLTQRKGFIQAIDLLRKALVCLSTPI